MLRGAVYIGAIALGISVYFGVTGLYVEKGRQEERARVAAKGAEIVRKVEKAQRANASRPAPSLLNEFYRD